MDQQHLLLLLNRLLANYFVIYVKLHRYQWYMEGEHSFMYQHFYKRIAILWKDDLDKLAEHILFSGGKPFATMVKFIKEASIEEATADDEEEEMIIQLMHNFSKMDKDFQHGIDHSLQLTDHCTYQLLIHLQSNVKKYLWKCKSFYH